MVKHENDSRHVGLAKRDRKYDLDFILCFYYFKGLWATEKAETMLIKRGSLLTHSLNRLFYCANS